MNFDEYWNSIHPYTSTTTLRDIAEDAWNAAKQSGTKEVKPKLEFTPEYADLIERVRKIDPSAAVYLEGEEIRELDFDQSFDLSSIVTWGNTPQGHDYWQNISEHFGDN